MKKCPQPCGADFRVRVWGRLGSLPHTPRDFFTSSEKPAYFIVPCDPSANGTQDPGGGMRLEEVAGDGAV